MENFTITITKANLTQTFDVRDYLHGEGTGYQCTIFLDGTMALHKEGDEQKTTKNPGGLDKETIRSIHAEIELYHRTKETNQTSPAPAYIET